MSKAVAASAAARVRLHLSPFTPAIFDSILPKAKQSLASCVTYHKTQSDPDRGFGYLELPADEADNLRKKLNGAILRGHKMSIEKARPEKRKAPHGDGAIVEEEPPRKKKSSKKAKSKDEIAGVELPADRKVKRGWTDATAKPDKDKRKHSSSREKSRYTDKDELLFRTTGTKPKSVKSAEKLDSRAKAKTKSNKSEKQIIHEFETTSKFPTFLKQAQSERKGGPLTYVDGQGWVDEAGHVVEEFKSNRPKPKPAGPVPADRPVKSTPSVEDTSEKPVNETLVKDESSASDSSSVSSESSAPNSVSDSSSSDEESISSIPSFSATVSIPNDPASASDPDPDLDPDSASDSDSNPTLAPNTTSTTTLALAPVSIPQPTAEPPTPPPTSTLPPPPPPPTADPTPTSPTKIHPLEALYKRTPRPAPIQTTFNFFTTSEDADDAEDPDPIIRAPQPTGAAPHTPFTATDLRLRGLRSAAPTPDTAVAGKRFFGFGRGDDEDVEEEGDEGGKKEKGSGRSAMVDEFYKRRSELNSSWKTRRREAVIDGFLL
ncbi:hypothetical protein K461DRAFT_137888 [Myriangium duriaei CBS 260.36]|uniref:Uncharacterized protein n=1 Tax=Myriangium duriaei CBS 260.36 TaxID=1168546 RepID=A0A9P4MN05_9PEZI|nr:hypothetical protein K461DRAFT_137888 [Myriangium duriaei CBS 260.36]